ncbi:hypothetical protein [Megamonas funiformis]|uniref:hypothetical protein n=1 Tax=Megamonas funiformis TaxID=437897 RepID=UPI0015A22608
MKDKINPLTNAGECSDETYKKAVEKRNRENFFHAFCRRILKMANKHLEKRHNIKILRIDFWDMETDNKKVMKVGKYE